MRMTWLIGAAAIAAGVAAPANAQFAPSLRSAPAASAPVSPVWRDTRDIRDRVAKGRDSGQLTRKEARRLRRGAGNIDFVASFYGQNGFTPSEERELAIRSRVLHEQVLAARSGVRPPSK